MGFIGGLVIGLPANGLYKRKRIMHVVGLMQITAAYTST